MNVLRGCCTFLLALLASSVVVGAPTESEEDAELDALLEVLAEETEIATKTKMTSDFVPGIVTVLDAEKLEALGVRSVWEAMPYIPGVQATLDGQGSPTVVVRGIPFPFNSGSIQIMVNSMPIGREAAGLNGSALFIPIVVVERLEFVRGPGSVVYGDFAFQGLLNIVTKRDAARVDLEADASETRGLGVAIGSSVGDWQYALNLAASNSDDALVPDNRAAEEQRRNAFLTLKHGGFSVNIQDIRRDLQGSDTQSQSLRFDEHSTSVDLRYERVLRPDLELRARTQHLRNDISNPAIGFEGDQLETGLELLWSGFTRQTWLAGLEYADAEIDNAYFAVPRPPGAPFLPPLQLGQRTRTVSSAFLQDQIELSDRVGVTLGARYDDNSDVGARVTPRASVVWRIAENHIIKGQYAEGFRSPTFFELYTDGPNRAELDFEVNATSEINYIYQRPNLTARATAFRSRIDDMVFRDFQNNRFGNVSSASADGVELEWSQQIGPSWRVDANLSWVDSEHDRNPQLITREVTAAAEWMGNLGVLWRMRPNLVLGLHWNHVGEREGATPGDGDYDQVDITLTRQNLFTPGLDFRIGVNNALDERILHLVASPVSDISFPYQERTLWARLTWNWR